MGKGVDTIPKSSITLIPVLRLVFLMWLAYFIQDFFEVDLAFLGILPRSGVGVLGIVTGPLVHGSFQHILSNSVPFLVLGGMVYFFYPAIAGRVMLQTYFFTNFFVWLLGRPFIHLGSSGLVYGFAFFLIFLGLFRRDFKTLLIAIVVIGVYGGLIYNVINLDDRVSWEAHLFGSIVGVANAYTANRFFKNFE